MHTHGTTNGKAIDDPALLRRRISELELQVANQADELRIFKALAHYAPDAIGVAALDGTMIYTNPAFQSMIGERSVVGRPMDELFAEPAERISGITQHVLEQGPWRGVLNYQQQNGGTFAGQMSGFAIRDADEQPLALAAIARDVSAQQEHDRQLRVFHALAEYAPDGILVLSLDGQITYANPAFRELTGYGDEVIGMNSLAFVGDDLSQFADIMPQLQSQGFARGLIRYHRKDGSTFQGHHSTFMLRSAEGRVEEMVAIIRNVTAQQEQAQRVEQSEAYLRAMFGAMHDLVLVLSGDGTYIDIPPTKPDLLYRPSADLLGKRMHDVMPRELAEQYLARIRNVLATKTTEQFLYALPVAGGEAWFSATISPLSEASVLWVARDITAQRQAEAERLALQDQVIAAQQAALRELSTPIIPLTDDVVAMPLIGSIDSARAQQVIETLLEGVAATRATTAILDITGVQVVDTQVANGLLRAAQAVKLLGAQVVITGIRPEVAQTLVGLGLELNGIVTRATLQSGISFALAQQAQAH